MRHTTMRRTAMHTTMWYSYSMQHTAMLACICLLACMLACLPACMPACLPAFMPACMHACIPACLRVCLPAHMSACLFAVDCFVMKTQENRRLGVFCRSVGFPDRGHLRVAWRQAKANKRARHACNSCSVRTTLLANIGFDIPLEIIPKETRRSYIAHNPKGVAKSKHPYLYERYLLKSCMQARLLVCMLACLLVCLLVCLPVCCLSAACLLAWNLHVDNVCLSACLACALNTCKAYVCFSSKACTEESKDRSPVKIALHAEAIESKARSPIKIGSKTPQRCSTTTSCSRKLKACMQAGRAFRQARQASQTGKADRQARQTRETGKGESSSQELQVVITAAALFLHRREVQSAAMHVACMLYIARVPVEFKSLAIARVPFGSLTLAGRCTSNKFRCAFHVDA